MADPSISARLREIQERIASAAYRCHRSPHEILLIAVSKGHPIESVSDALAAGQMVFGENYLEEAIEKIESLPAALEWHMTGHVQSRKAAAVATRFSAVHSIDSLALAEKLSRHCLEHQKTLRVFMECNVSGEATKSGFECAHPSAWKAQFPIWQSIARLPSIELAGLMTMAPYGATNQVIRDVFQSLRSLRDSARETPGLETLAGLSMGMSDDFEEAIGEGATCVRIGRAIFGPRKTASSR
jgi:PLP dependent protein